jgi:hypothetical protein
MYLEGMALQSDWVVLIWRDTSTSDIVERMKKALFAR